MSKQDAILEAARQLFTSLGYRAVSMEAVAKAAFVAKATLYAYYPDKATLFGAMADNLAQRLQTALLAPLQKASSENLASSLVAGFVAKERLVYEWVRNSPHAGELFAAKNAMARERFAKLDAVLIEQIGAVLQAHFAQKKSGEGSQVVSKLTKAKAGQLARITFYAALGLANQSESLTQYEKDVDMLVGRMLIA